MRRVCRAALWSDERCRVAVVYCDPELPPPPPNWLLFSEYVVPELRNLEKLGLPLDLSLSAVPKP
jgi:hypothetical protein